MASAGPSSCLVCGAPRRADARFCGECGAPVAAQESPRPVGPPPPSAQGQGAQGQGAQGREKTRDAPTLAGLPAADPRAPTDPALMLGLRPTTDDDDLPTRTRRSASAAAHDDKTEFQRLLAEVETGFDSILLDDAVPSTSGLAMSAFDTAEVGRLFEQITVTHARPVRDFMVELQLGEPPTAWIAFCRPAVRALERSALGMDRLDLAAALDALATALDRAAEESGSVLRDPARQSILDAYEPLVTKMPDAFALSQESDRREAVIVHALLAQVAGLHKVGIDRLYGAGMTSLALYAVARPSDLVEIAHLDLEVAARVLDRFARYRRESIELVPDDGRALELDRIEALCDALERATASYDEASASRSAGSSAWRKELRRARADALAQIRLLLARLGELELLERVEALPTAAKIVELRGFVAVARQEWRSNG